MLSEQTIKTKHKVGGNYAHYTLGVLWIVYMFEVMDKSLISILAEDIKADLGTTDAQMGFLAGTAFGLCYALFGIPFARLADVWTRRNVLAIGLSFWSLVTVLTGLARSFSVLTAFRFAMGIGTSANTPHLYIDDLRPLSESSATDCHGDLTRRPVRRHGPGCFCGRFLFSIGGQPHIPLTHRLDSRDGRLLSSRSGLPVCWWLRGSGHCGNPGAG